MQSLEDKIEKRETELQRWYDNAILEEAELIEEIKKLEEAKNIKIEKLNKVSALIMRCIDKAEELGYTGIL
jgi:hypothetical protein